MKMTMANKDVRAIENGMMKYNTDSKGFLEVVNEMIEKHKHNEDTPQYDLLLHLKECVETYIEWGM